MASAILSYLIPTTTLLNSVKSQSGLRDCLDLTTVTRGQADLYNTACQCKKNSFN